MSASQPFFAVATLDAGPPSTMAIMCATAFSSSTTRIRKGSLIIPERISRTQAAALRRCYSLIVICSEPQEHGELRQEIERNRGEIYSDKIAADRSGFTL